MRVENKVIIIGSLEHFPIMLIVLKILALKEWEIHTFGGKSFAYTFFHNSIGEWAWSFPMSLSGTGGDPKIGVKFYSNDCID